MIDKYVRKKKNELLEDIQQFIFSWDEYNPYEKEITEVARALATSMVLNGQQEMEVKAAYGGKMYKIRVYQTLETIELEVSDWGLTDS